MGEHLFIRARGRTRTGTASLPGDFESPTSTNSITRAYSIMIRQEQLNRNWTCMKI